MKKPTDLRAYLTEQVPCLKRDPDSLHVFVEKGRLATCLGGGLSFEYRYELSLLATEFTDHPDTLMIPLLAWLQLNQPDKLLNPDGQDNALRFEAEILDHKRADILVTLELSERVVVELENGVYKATHCAEPPLPDLGGPTPWQMFANGVEVTNG